MDRRAARRPRPGAGRPRAARDRCPRLLVSIHRPHALSLADDGLGHYHPHLGNAALVIELQHHHRGRDASVRSLPRSARPWEFASFRSHRELARPPHRPALPTHLKRLEAESIEIMREVVAEFRKPVMLYSIGKDSSVMLHLAIEGLSIPQAALSAAACRHDLEVPGDDRVPRRDGASASV